MEPPEASPGNILTDLRWNNELYKCDNLTLRTRLAFIALRTIQLLAYSRGWNKAAKEINNENTGSSTIERGGPRKPQF